MQKATHHTLWIGAIEWRLAGNAFWHDMRATISKLAANMTVQESFYLDKWYHLKKRSVNLFREGLIRYLSRRKYPSRKTVVTQTNFQTRLACA